MWELIALVFLALPAAIIVLSFFPAFYKKVVEKVPKIIEIEDEFISGNSENNYFCKRLETVKCIIDVGDWYVFDFFFPHKNRYFVCQKDLLVEGSIEEFESLFKGKIKRKTNLQ